FQLPEVERDVRWPELAAMARLGEQLGFDSIWVGDHLLYRDETYGARGPWEAWTQLAGIAAVTSRIAIGPLVACTILHNPGMLAITVPYVSAWNAWYRQTGNRPDGVAALRETVDKACTDAGRKPGEIERTVAVLVEVPGGSGRKDAYEASAVASPLRGSSEEIANELRAYAREGIGHVQLIVEPMTEASLEALAPVLENLDRKPPDAT